MKPRKGNVTQDFHEQEIEFDNGEGEIEIVYADLRVEANCFYQAAKLDGPPENCYPEDSECEITRIEVLKAIDEDGNVLTLSKEKLALIQAAIDEDHLSDEIFEAWMDSRYDEYEE